MNEINKKTLKERAKENELNCNAGTMQLLYSLAEHGLLKKNHLEVGQLDLSRYQEKN